MDDNSTGGTKFVRMNDGGYLLQLYASPKIRLNLTARTDVQNITAVRLELLTDLNLPLGGPGRSRKGTCALTEFELEEAPADAPEKITKVKFATATADVNPPETPLDPLFDDKSGKRRVTGPVEFAIDGKDETAWGIDVGPGLRNQSRKAVFVASAPISNPGGTILTFYLKQDHGGGDGTQDANNDLGRFRLSITNQPGATADPLPANVREILSIPRTQRTPAQTQTVFSYWRTTLPEWSEANERIAQLWKEYPEGTSQLVLQQMPQARETHVLKRGDFLQPGQSGNAGCSRFPPSFTARFVLERRSAYAADLCGVAGGS